MVNEKTNKKALILVGGYGTRLRPLTSTLPKPLVPFINKPILEYQIEALIDAGVSEIILALNYFSDLIENFVNNIKDKYSISIILSKEDYVLGTGGPLALARKYLTGNFFVLNSDVICNYPLKEMYKAHISLNKEVTMLTTTVDDPTKYGVIETHGSSCLVKSFVEKPSSKTNKTINAGIYIFNESIMKRIELRECSLEKDIFPKVVKDNNLATYKLKGFWMDIGQIKDYLLGQRMYLEFYKLQACDNIDFTNNVVFGKNVKVGKNVQICNSAIFDNVDIGDNVIIKDSIIGWNSIIRSGAIICNGSVLGDSVSVYEKCKLDSILVQPNKTIQNYLSN